VHNIINSLGAIAIASALEISPDVISASLSHFFGTERRFQLKGTYKGAKVIDDYAHHPQEITATLSAAKNMGRIVLIFQPHTYSRTKALFNDFASSLSAADEVILAPIYAARETDTLGMDSKLLADAVSALGTNAAGFDSFSEIKEHIKKIARPGDLIITMGAGDVYKIGEDLINDTDKD
jgi:UDP-N-acetylmuramate--alanine ligase